MVTRNMTAKERYPQMDNMAFARHLAGMIPYQTIVNARYDDTVDWSQFTGLETYLEETYPLLHQKLYKEKIGGYTLLYHWKGTGESGKQPILFMAHQDVVPVTPGTEGDWEKDPFGGEIADGYVWGRGSCDCKGQMLAVLESVTYLLQQGFTPDRDIYLAFGHDEEVGGKKGATAAAQYCRDHGIFFDAVFDEGSGLNHGEGIDVGDTYLYSVGTFEKGYVDLELTVEDEGGHSSQPKEQTALGILAGAIVRAEGAKFPYEIPPSVRQYLELAGPYAVDEELRELCRDTGKNEQAIIQKMTEDNLMGQAMLRTSTAATMANASPAPNILPQKASAVLNFRLNPRETVEGVRRHIKEAIQDDRVGVEVKMGMEPSKISRTDGEPWKALRHTIRQFYPQAVLVPSSVLGGTDARQFEKVCDYVYRISFFNATDQKEQDGYEENVHGTNEKNPVAILADGVALCTELMQTLCTKEGRDSIEA